jgi:hypothetical protein
MSYFDNSGKLLSSWLSHYAIDREVASAILVEVIGVYSLLNPTSCGPGVDSSSIRNE